MEIFPFFSWFLFALTPNPSAEYNFQIITYGEQTFSPPIIYNEAKGIVPSPNSIKVPRLATTMAKALEENQTDEYHTAKRVFESNYLDNQKSIYQLIEINYDPLERWKTGEVKVTPVQTITIP